MRKQKSKTKISLTAHETTFGDLLRAFRYNAGLRQRDVVVRFNELSSEAKLDIPTLSRLENNHGKILTREILTYLAIVLELNSIQKVKFFESVGFVYVAETPLRISNENNVEEQIRKFIEEIPYPAHVITPLWDIVSFNKYIYYLYGYDKNPIVNRESGVDTFSVNLLRIIFDDVKKKDPHYYGDRVKIEQQLLRNLRAFRELSYAYTHTQRYGLLMTLMNNDFPLFQRLSTFAMLDDSRHEVGYELPVEPSTQIVVSGIGEMKFWTLRFPQEYIGGEVIILVHLPASKTDEDRLRQFEKERHIPLRMEARYFGIPSLDS